MGFYVASRVRHAGMWRGLRAEGAGIISTWIDEAGEGETGSFTELWGRILVEVSRCDALVFYANADDFPLKGALVEVGMALAFGKPVVAVLDGVEIHPRSLRPVGSWLASEGVRVAPSVRAALGLFGSSDLDVVRWEGEGGR